MVLIYLKEYSSFYERHPPYPELRLRPSNKTYIDVILRRHDEES